MAVIPSTDPATLKSISPIWSSVPKISVRIAYLFLSSIISPMAMPAMGILTGTPASMRANDDPQTVAMDEDPFDSRISDTRRTV